jgi:hypothetical protein
VKVGVAGLPESRPHPTLRRQFVSKLLAHLHKKGKVNHATFEEIDWEASGRAFDDMPQLFQMWATKHISGWCGVNSMRFVWDQSDTHNCPNCGACYEKTEHLPVCPATNMQECWEGSIDGFEIWLTIVDTHPDIQHCLLSTLRERKITASFARHASPATLQAAQSQDRIGWINLVEGKISKQWSELQAAHYRSQGSRRTATRWATDLVTNLLEISHEQWLQRNGGLYELTDNGLLVEDAALLLSDLQAEMDRGTIGLNSEDRYLIRPMAELSTLTAAAQQRWLQNIRFTRQSLAENNTVLGRMRDCMHRFLHPDPAT